MIQYALKCDQGHQFDSWFHSASAFDKLKASGHLSCGVCGSSEVDKALMAPRVSQSVREETATQTGGEPVKARDDTDAQRALQALKAHVEKNSDYVGTGFAKEARAMHLGEAPERPIWGEAAPKEAKALIDDGIPVAPLPFTPTRKAN